MKVLFVIKEIDFADHIAVPYLSAVAKELGWETNLCILDQTDLMRAVHRERPDVVAYSANVMSFEALTAAHREAQSEFAFISIMGGPHPTFSPETFASAGVDAFCAGEGELVFRDFLRRIEQGRSFDDVPNLITAKGRNEVRPLVDCLDELPFPDRDITLADTFLKDTPKKTFYATRGCPFSCSYCCNNYYKKLYRGKGRIARRFSVERVIREIEFVRDRYRMDFVKFGDDLFAMKADDWLEEFAREYAGRIGIPFNCYLRLDRVDADLLRLLKQAGCYSVHLSVDSTSEVVREKVLGRRMRQIDIVETLRLIHSFGINTWVNYMLAAPGSTLADDLGTIALNKKAHVTYPAYSTTVPVKGTALYDYSLQRGLIDPDGPINGLAGCSQISTLRGWSLRERQIRYNIFLVGAVIAKLPFPLDWLATQMIKVVPPNRVFVKLRQVYYRYSIENRIFNLYRYGRPALVKVKAAVCDRREDPPSARQPLACRQGIMPLPGRESSHGRTVERVLCSKENECL
ncbi:MAG: B12-binding domain-containing radical SAM protein [Sedimentisphaerales bacterium]|nr:B12-binding domain-containing radical SAM protein [Sedimentisphaerales bacterium]